MFGAVQSPELLQLNQRLAQEPPIEVTVRLPRVLADKLEALGGLQKTRLEIVCLGLLLPEDGKIPVTVV